MSTEPTYNFDPTEPASCVANGRGGEGIYRQRGACWYFDGRCGAVQIDHLAHLSQDELLAYGRGILLRRLASGGGW